MLSVPRFDDESSGVSEESGFFGFRSVGKILITSSVIPAARLTMAVM